MEATFKEIIAKTRPTSEPHAASDTIGKESLVSSEGIAGIVVGVFTGISLIILGIRWLRRWSKVRVRAPDILEINGISFSEMSTKLILPQELHSSGFAHHAQELNACMPNEMPSTIDGASHFCTVANVVRGTPGPRLPQPK